MINEYKDSQQLMWMAQFVLRRSAEANTRVMHVWWEEIQTWSYQDQISFPFALFKAGKDLRIATVNRPADWQHSKSYDKYNPASVCQMTLGEDTTCCRRCVHGKKTYVHETAGQSPKKARPGKAVCNMLTKSNVIVTEPFASS